MESMLFSRSSSNMPISMALAMNEVPFVIGMMLSCVLFGVAGAQTVYYYRAYPGDSSYIKLLVGILFLLDFVHQAFLAETVHFLYVASKDPKDLRNLLYIRWTFRAAFALQQFITYLVQIFYAYRVWTIGAKHKSRVPVVAAILGLAFLQFCTGFACVGLIAAHPFISAIHGPAQETLFSIELCLAVLADGLITFALIYYLHTSRLGFGSMENVIDKLIQITLHIGLLTTAVAISTFVTYHAMKRSTFFSSLLELISKIYVNSLLATLNSRRTTHLSDYQYDTQVLTTVVIDSEESYELSEDMSLRFNPFRSRGAVPPTKRVTFTNHSSRETTQGVSFSLDCEAGSRNRIENCRT